VISTVEKAILYLGQTFTGHNHDYAMLKKEFPPEEDWFVDLEILVDLAYLGMPETYRGESIHLPHKKPRRSKKNPETHLSEVQKTENRALSQIRVFVENAIGGVKRYNILMHRFRNHKPNFDDNVIGICAGLWNFSLTYQ